MLLAAFSYIFLEIGNYFVDFRSTFGLSETIRNFIGGMIRISIIMTILTPIVLKVGIKTE